MSKIGHNGGPPVTFSGDDGWIARHRSVRDHWLVGHGLRVKPADPSRRKCLNQGEAWEDLTMECRYSDGFIESGGKKLRLERGTLLGAVSWLGNRWNWTPQTVRTFLDKLEADGMIKRHVPGASENNKHVGKQATVLTICNYEKYQAFGDHEWQAKQQTNNNQAANNQQMSNNIYKDNKETKEQGNKEREVTPLPPAPADRPREGEEQIGVGVYVNCDTVRFVGNGRTEVISLRAIEVQTAGLAVPRDEIKNMVVAAALQWSAEVQAGKSPKIPQRLDLHFGRCLTNNFHNQAIADVRKQRAAKPAAKSTGLNWCSAEGIEEAMREIQKSEGKR